MLPVTVKNQLGIPRQVLIRSFTQIFLFWMEHAVMLLPSWILFSVSAVLVAVLLMKKIFFTVRPRSIWRLSFGLVTRIRYQQRPAGIAFSSLPSPSILPGLALTHFLKRYRKQTWAETELQGFFLVVYLGISRRETLRSFFEDLDESER